MKRITTRAWLICDWGAMKRRANAREALRLQPSLGSRKAYLVLADVHAEQAHYDALAMDLQTYPRLAPDGDNREDLQNLLGVAQRLAAKTASTN